MYHAKTIGTQKEPEQVLHLARLTWTTTSQELDKNRHKHNDIINDTKRGLSTLVTTTDYPQSPCSCLPSLSLGSCRESLLCLCQCRVCFKVHVVVSCRGACSAWSCRILPISRGSLVHRLVALVSSLSNTHFLLIFSSVVSREKDSTGTNFSVSKWRAGWEVVHVMSRLGKDSPDSPPNLSRSRGWIGTLSLIRGSDEVIQGHNLRWKNQKSDRIYRGGVRDLSEICSTHQAKNGYLGITHFEDFIKPYS